MNDLFGIIKGPCLTEKTDQLQENYGKVVLKVDMRANKIEIKRAVEKNFNVKVKNVRTSTVHGRRKRVGRHVGYAANWKKATVTLSEGKINFLEDL